MKTYFWSGNTEIVYGISKQACGTILVESNDDINDVISKLVESKTKEFDGNFVLTSFNRLD